MIAGIVGFAAGVIVGFACGFLVYRNNSKKFVEMEEELKAQIQEKEDALNSLLLKKKKD